MNDKKIAQWDEQFRQQQEQLDDEAHRLREEQEGLLAQEAKEEEEQRREEEKKKPKIGTFDPNHGIGSFLAPCPSTFALNKLNALKYIELNYFSLKGCKFLTPSTS